jgi:hypothetical protein
MKTPQPPKSRFEKRRAAYLKQIGSLGPFVEGTLVRIPHKKCKHVAHRLTFKVKGKTKAVYVPVDCVEEVIEWTRQYRELKKLTRSVSKMSLAMLHNHVRAKRAAQPRSAPKSPRSAKRS